MPPHPPTSPHTHHYHHHHHVLGRVRSLSQVFWQATAFGQDVGAWDVSMVAEPSDCGGARLNYQDKDQGKVATLKFGPMEGTFEGTGLSVCDRKNIYDSWGGVQKHSEFLEMWGAWGTLRCVVCSPWEKATSMNTDAASCEPALWLNLTACYDQSDDDDVMQALRDPSIQLLWNTYIGDPFGVEFPQETRSNTHVFGTHIGEQFSVRKIPGGQCTPLGDYTRIFSTFLENIGRRSHGALLLKTIMTAGTDALQKHSLPLCKIGR